MQLKYNTLNNTNTKTHLETQITLSANFFNINCGHKRCHYYFYGNFMVTYRV